MPDHDTPTDFISTRERLPEKGQVVDWITPDGKQVNGGSYDSRLWFLPPAHDVYCYYTPVAWRPSDIGEPMIGMNLSGNVDWQTGRYWLDLPNVLRAWGLPSTPYKPAAFPLSPDGYPTVDFGGFAELRNYPSGLYAYGYQGSGELRWTAGATADTRTAGARSGTVVIDGDSGNLSFKVEGVNPADPFRDLSVRRVSGPSTGTFDPDFLASLKPYPVLRFMDWTHTNYPVVREWADRPLPQHQQTVTPGSPGKGVALEHCLELCRLTGAAAWLCVPHTASDDYVRQMAALVAGSGVKVYLEFSNEPWNGIFPAHAKLLADAAANTALDATDKYARLYQHVAWRLMKAMLAFQSAGVNVVGVLAGQAVNPWLAEQGLDFLERKVGLTVGVLAYGDYFITDADGPAAPPYPLLDRSLMWVRAYRALADKYGVPAVAAYEGGQHLTGSDPAKLAAQTAPVMGDLYRKALAQFHAYAGPGAVWCAFASPASWGDGRDGYWGLAPKLGATTPKLTAVLEAAGQDPPPPPPPPPPAPTAGFTGTVTYTYADGRLVKAPEATRAP